MGESQLKINVNHVASEALAKGKKMEANQTNIFCRK